MTGFTALPVDIVLAIGGRLYTERRWTDLVNLSATCSQTRADLMPLVKRAWRWWRFRWALQDRYRTHPARPLWTSGGFADPCRSPLYGMIVAVKAQWTRLLRLQAPRARNIPTVFSFSMEDPRHRAALQALRGVLGAMHMCSIAASRMCPTDTLLDKRGATAVLREERMFHVTWSHPSAPSGGKYVSPRQFYKGCPWQDVPVHWRPYEYHYFGDVRIDMNIDRMPARKIPHPV